MSPVIITLFDKDYCPIFRQYQYFVPAEFTEDYCNIYIQHVLQYVPLNETLLKNKQLNKVEAAYLTVNLAHMTKFGL